VLAPRGELSRKALNHKKIKKNIFMQLASFIGLYKGISWHGSSESECAQIRDYLLQFETNPELSTVHAAMDLRPALDFDTTPKPEKQNGSLLLVFLARIHPIKQLNVALEVLKEVRGDVFFGIYGPIDPGEETYWIRCQALIRELPSNIKVEYHGTLDSFKVGAELHKYHAFFMPTLTENYGHSIAEALSAGCPVVISDQTPWRGLSDKGIGWDVPLDRFDLFVKAIQELVDMPAQEYNEMSAGCKKYAEMEANSPETLEAYRLMFRQTAQKCDN
jgi:glycosyltransferase involved in cell wall biosynthesis